MLKMHLRYEEDAEVEESIEEDLKQLYREGNVIFKARKRKRDDIDNDAQNSKSKEEEEENEEEDLTVFIV